MGSEDLAPCLMAKVYAQYYCSRVLSSSYDLRIDVLGSLASRIRNCKYLLIIIIIALTNKRLKSVMTAAMVLHHVPLTWAHMTFWISCLDALRVSAHGSLLFSCNMPAEGHELGPMPEH